MMIALISFRDNKTNLIRVSPSFSRHAKEFTAVCRMWLLFVL